MFSRPLRTSLDHNIRSQLGTTRQAHDNDQTCHDTSGRTWPPIDALLFEARLNGDTCDKSLRMEIPFLVALG